ncbi:estradiol 17-beta-dehydrogenase 8 isoform X1 [Polypterus senegalus]|uniref:estradiol 17-beta-dehydrogenase 8 isoform X1 n=1 Tax=Polypterus senegalus TaxID=55291 RepID=UPI001963082D|nr:estradiol 17-beta-dehydrogenase 8 isoform X1 [Polypterus senegalus]
MSASVKLASRLAVITGGGSGIGRAVCQRFAQEGASVVIADINEVSANETLKLLSHNNEDHKHSAFIVDVTSKRSVEQLFSQIQLRYFRPPCISVSAAGITQDEFLIKLEEDAFDKVLQVNLKGTFLVTQALAKALISSGLSKGSIINVGSIVGKVGNLGQVNYAASKAGVEGLTKTAAKELGRYGIRCNCVLPGFILTPMIEKVPQKLLEKFAGMVPLGRLGQASDVADACVFLASNESQYITGASLEVTGGLFIG